MNSRLRHQTETHGACHSRRTGRRCAAQNSAGWILPGLMLILLPKCPLCLAASLSLLFGIGLSAQAATVVHGTIIAWCIMAIVAFIARQISSCRKRHVAGKVPILFRANPTPRPKPH
jgi:hypothetical protein